MKKSNADSMLVVGLLWILVVGLCFGGQFFYGKIKSAVSLKDVIEVAKYDFVYGDNKKISYGLPKSWKVTENKSLEAGDVLYFVDFDGQADKIYGDIQMIKSNLKLADMIHNRIELLNKNSDISKCNSQLLENTKEKSYKIYYNIESVHGLISEHKEYYIDLGDNYIKVSFSKLNGIFSDDDCDYIDSVISNITKK